MTVDNSYEWIPFYEELADDLLTYSDKREELHVIMKELASEEPLMEYLDKEDRIDPFTVMGVLNRGATVQNRTMLSRKFARTCDLMQPAPTQFNGIPVLTPMNSLFHGTNEMWELFMQAMRAAETGHFSNEFKAAFEKSINIKGNALAKITMGLYWIRPSFFMPLDKNSRAYISDYYGISVPNNNCTGSEYVTFLETLKLRINEQSPKLTFPEISYAARMREDNKEPPVTDTNVHQVANHTIPKNIILYGAPGTGKTYSSIQYAVAIIEEEQLFDVRTEDYNSVFARYLKYKDDGLVAFTTFHQSYGYEEFIEGIRPVVSPEDKAESLGEIEYEIHNGVFKDFCDKADTPVGSVSNDNFGIGKSPTVWKVSLAGTGDNPTRTECMENNHIRIGWDDYGEIITDATDYSTAGGKIVLDSFYNKMQIGDIIFSCYSNRTIDAIGVVTGEPEWRDEYPTYKRLRAVKWLAKGIEENIVDLNAGKTMTLPTVHKLSVSASDAIDLLRKVEPELFTENVKIPNRVFIIDEINRGNIAKIFGELITLIEPTKRIGASEQMRSSLPYSGQKFGVPNNVYIIGTMNTADRSIARIDVALRRRFSFVEMRPEAEVLKDIFVDGIDIAEMLNTLNKRITILLDREHIIGHSYFLILKEDPSINRLATIFENKIVPLLQEYFYDDYEKIQLVLGDNQKLDDSTRFIVKKTDIMQLFGNADINYPEYYIINSAAFREVDAYAFF